jgi:hypothetical protein
MKTVKEMIELINAAKYNTPDYEEVLEGARVVATIDRDEHRWYTIGTVVYQVGAGFIGVRGVISIKSESMGYSDCAIEYVAFEMVAVPSVTYIAKE